MFIRRETLLESIFAVNCILTVALIPFSPAIVHELVNIAGIKVEIRVVELNNSRFSARYCAFNNHCSDKQRQH